MSPACSRFPEPLGIHGILSNIRYFSSMPHLPGSTVITLLTTLLTATAEPTQDLLLVLPLDTAVVAVDSNVSVSALPRGSSRRDAAAPSPAPRIARGFHPAFGSAIFYAARGVEVIDSSAATAPFDDPDSSRYSLVIEALHFSQTTRTVARRTVPPSPPGFDPATGMMTPGVHRAYSEGPGRMTTLSVSASWSIRDHAGDSALVTGDAVGTTVFRGDARRVDWEAAARVLALDLLRRTPFSPDDVPPAAIPGKNAP